MTATENRTTKAIEIAREAGQLAAEFFADITALNISAKGAQDMVSNADIAVETFVRDRLAAEFPNDAIIGEEHAPTSGTSGWTWVIDPIDGTANFISGIPQWCVILACVQDGETQVGVVYDPCHDEMFSAFKGGGAFVNNQRLSVSGSVALNDGSVGVGMNGRTDTAQVIQVMTNLVKRGGVFFRNASGGLMLSYVAAGRLIGYTEPHMNAWDCLAAQLLITEAGGVVEPQNMAAMLQDGGRVITAAPGVYPELLSISLAAFEVK